MCKYCEGNVDDRKLIDEEYEEDIYICGNGCLTIGDYVSVKLKCCPFCERKL